MVLGHWMTKESGKYVSLHTMMCIVACRVTQDCWVNGSMEYDDQQSRSPDQWWFIHSLFALLPTMASSDNGSSADLFSTEHDDSLSH
jgi:hypothetical protein